MAPPVAPNAWQTTSNVLNFGLNSTAGSPATANVPVPGILGSLVKAVKPGTKLRGAKVFQPSVENEKAHPSLKAKSFHAPANQVPLGFIPNDSSLSANRSALTFTVVPTWIPLAPALTGMATPAMAIRTAERTRTRATN